MHKTTLEKSNKCKNCGQWSFEKDINNFPLEDKINKAIELIESSKNEEALKALKDVKIETEINEK